MYIDHRSIWLAASAIVTLSTSDIAARAQARHVEVFGPFAARAWADGADAHAQGDTFSACS